MLHSEAQVRREHAMNDLIRTPIERALCIERALSIERALLGEDLYMRGGFLAMVLRALHGVATKARQRRGPWRERCGQAAGLSISLTFRTTARGGWIRKELYL